MVLRLHKKKFNSVKDVLNEVTQQNVYNINLTIVMFRGTPCTV